MKKSLILISIVALFMVLTVASVGAAPSSYASCFAVQNLDGANIATINIQFLEQTSSSTDVNVPATINPGASVAFCPLDALSSGFNGSAVISSDFQVAAIVNVSGDESFSTYNASYSSFSSGSTSVNLPALFDDNYGFNTWFNVQNIGSSTTDVTVNYSDGTSVGPVSIESGRSYTFDQVTETHSQNVFAASISSSTQPIVATVMEVGPSNAPMLFGYNGFGDSATNPVMPLILMNQYGYTSAIQIQNVDSAVDTSVTVAYTPSSNTASCEGGTCGTSCTETHTITAGSSETFALNGCISSQTTFVGSAEVTINTGNVGLVAIVNQHEFGSNKGSSYSAFNPATATDTVVMPAIFDRNYGYFTGFNLLNVGASTTVNCTFSNSSYTISQNLGAGAVLTDVQLDNAALGDGYVGSATCTASSGGSLIAVVNEAKLGGTQDTFLTYEAANQ